MTDEFEHDVFDVEHFFKVNLLKQVWNFICFHYKFAI